MIGSIGSLPTTDHFTTTRTRMGELASAKKSVTFNSPATLMIGSRILANAQMTGARIGNMQREVSFNQTKSSFMQSAQNTVTRLRELATQANNGILTTADRTSINAEAKELFKHLKDIENHASFNGMPLMQSDEFKSLTSSLQDMDMTSQSGISDAAQNLDSAMDTLATMQAQVGAETRALLEQEEAAMAEMANQVDAGSRIVGTDMAASFSAMTSSQILSDVSVAMQAQAMDMDSATVAALLS